jgi:hypothetical protein
VAGTAYVLSLGLRVMGRKHQQPTHRES